MKNPFDGLLPTGPAKILFCSEGNPVAILASNKAGRHTTKPMQFAQAEAALSWCRSHGAMMVYCPAGVERN
jgi:hypothetical protein